MGTLVRLIKLRSEFSISRRESLYGLRRFSAEDGAARQEIIPDNSPLFPGEDAIFFRADIGQITIEGHTIGGRCLFVHWNYVTFLFQAKKVSTVFPVFWVG